MCRGRTARQPDPCARRIPRAAKRHPRLAPRRAKLPFVQPCARGAIGVGHVEAKVLGRCAVQRARLFYAQPVAATVRNRATHPSRPANNACQLDAALSRPERRSVACASPLWRVAKPRAGTPRLARLDPLPGRDLSTLVCTPCARCPDSPPSGSCRWKIRPETRSSCAEHTSFRTQYASAHALVEGFGSFLARQMARSELGSWPRGREHRATGALPRATPCPWGGAG